MSRRPIVFAPQEPMRKEHGIWVSKGLNLSASAEYGELLIVWPPDASILTRTNIENEARVAAERYNDKVDWIVALGSPTLIGALAWAVGSLGKELRILEWDREAKRYASTLGVTNAD